MQSMNVSKEEAEIRELIKQWSAALEAKDLDGMTARYDAHAVMYDAIPPYKTVGPEAIRAAWESCLPHFPEKFESRHHDLTYHVGPEVAAVYGLHHIVVPGEPDHPAAACYLRVSVVYRKIEGQWRVVHEHMSLPFNPLDNQAWQIKDPSNLSQPDYHAGCETAGA